MSQDEDVILTERFSVEGRTIIKVLDPVFTIVGKDQLDLAKSNLKHHAKAKGGNAVIGFSVDPMPEDRSIKVSGTAVLIE